MEFGQRKAWFPDVALQTYFYNVLPAVAFSLFPPARMSQGG